jgi:YHS domain-containing protein
MLRSALSTRRFHLDFHRSAALSRRLLLMGAVTAIAGGAFAPSSPAEANTPSRTALSGYDPVSYFSPGHPEQGSASFSYPFDNTNYFFTSEKHRKMFVANPQRYAPLFRGYCATGVASGEKPEGDPQLWTIYHGKLLVFGNQQAKSTFEADPAGVFQRANANWRTLRNN